MGMKFNAIQERILLAFTEALFHGTAMAIPPRQVVDNIQTQFGLMNGNARDEVGLSLYLLCLVMGGPLFLLMGPAWRMRRIEKRLARSRNDLMQEDRKSVV